MSEDTDICGVGWQRYRLEWADYLFDRFPNGRGHLIGMSVADGVVIARVQFPNRHNGAVREYHVDQETQQIVNHN